MAQIFTAAPVLFFALDMDRPMQHVVDHPALYKEVRAFYPHSVEVLLLASARLCLTRQQPCARARLLTHSSFALVHTVLVWPVAHAPVHDDVGAAGLHPSGRRVLVRYRGPRCVRRGRREYRPARAGVVSVWVRWRSLMGASGRA